MACVGIAYLDMLREHSQPGISETRVPEPHVGKEEEEEEATSIQHLI